MRRISSRFTWCHKKAFPVFVFGLLGVYTLIWIFAVIQQRAPALTLLLLLGIAAFVFLQMRWLSPLIDEVFIDNDEIVVKSGGQEDRVPITNIISIKDYTLARPERIVLILKEPCRFGGEIMFLPSCRMCRFWTTHPIVEVLNRSIDEVIGAGLR
jgi:hypothetical protein